MSEFSKALTDYRHAVRNARAWEAAGRYGDGHLEAAQQAEQRTHRKVLAAHKAASHRVKLSPADESLLRDKLSAIYCDNFHDHLPERGEPVTCHVGDTLWDEFLPVLNAVLTEGD